MDDLESLAADVGPADSVVAFTGAGISAPSGVPTFRGDDGVWDRFDEGQFEYGRFQRDPAGFWEDRLELQAVMFDEDYEPNAGHEALAELAADGVLEAILTQNTDGLHRAAARGGGESDGPGQVPADAGDETGGAGAPADVDDGVDDSDDDAPILELHGNSQRVRCVECGRRHPNEPIAERVRNGEVPPTCDCGGVYKPDVVLFGEQLPATVLQQARSLARESDVFLAIGSSLVVEPAASLPRIAASAGASVAVVNLEPTPCDSIADVVCRDNVTEALPRFRAAVDP